MTSLPRHTPEPHITPTAASRSVRAGGCKAGAAWALGVVMALGLGGVAGGAWAQQMAPGIAPGSSSSSAPAPPAPAASGAAAVPEAPAVPKYGASDIKTIFNYLDRNRDGAISRDEAAGFKGVARNFDRADTNKDGVLSFDEFEFAMNRAK